MIIHPGVMGIDISKDFFDVFDASCGEHERIANTVDEAEGLARRCAGNATFVLFEATGRYDVGLRRALSRHNVVFARVNPARARDFARAAGYLAKTDEVDAKMLAAMAQCLRPQACEAFSPDRDRLGLLHKRRDQLVATRQQERTRNSECSDPELTAGLDRHLGFLDAEIKQLDRRIGELMASDEQMQRLRLLLRSAPGVGPVTAATLIALLPELGQRSPKTIAALVGLAPFNRDSGRYRGMRKIHGGRKRVRDALYMAALAAARSPTRFRATYQALRKAGKPAKLAIIAVARKLLVILNAIVRDQTPFKTA